MADWQGLYRHCVALLTLSSTMLVGVFGALPTGMSYPPPCLVHSMQMTDAATTATTTLKQHIDKTNTKCALPGCQRLERSKPIYSFWNPKLYCEGCGHAFCCTACHEAHTAGRGQCSGNLVNTRKGMEGYTKQAWEEAAVQSRVSLTPPVTMALSPTPVPCCHVHINADCYTCLHSVCVH